MPSSFVRWLTEKARTPATTTAVVRNFRKRDSGVLDQEVTTARRKALLDFVRGGKSIVGIHAATDSYPGDRGAAPAPGGRDPVDGGAPLWPSSIS
jgi:hypothetical protein